MKSEIIKQEKTVVEIKLTFLQDEVIDQLENAYRDISQKANIKGFRRGKVPRVILEKYYPKQSILPEVAENLLTKSLQGIVEEYDLNLISDPDIKLEKLELGSDFVVNVTFNVEPDFELPNLQDIAVTKTVVKITDNMVEDELKEIQKSYPKTVPTYEDRALVAGDVASVKYTTKIYYNDSTEHSSNEEFKSEIKLEKGYTRPEFLENLVGKKPGEKVKIEITYSVDNSVKTKERKISKSIYNIEVLGILKEEIPELTDDHVKELSQGKLESVEALKNDIRTQLESMEESRAQETLKADVMERISSSIDIELPEVMVSREKENIKKRQETECEKERISLEDFLKKNGITKDENEKKVDEIAKQTVKNTLILYHIVRDDNITLEESDYNKELINMSMKMGLSPKQISDNLMKNEQAFASFKESVLMKKALDAVISKVKVTTNSVTREDFAKTLEKIRETSKGQSAAKATKTTDKAKTVTKSKSATTKVKTERKTAKRAKTTAKKDTTEQLLLNLDDKDSTKD
ncbi:MAG: trigger factor [Synergistaceae bacterium]|nr:trigger factor [Synergistaceae bacterium]